ncbi:hypothetical protein GH714_031288 [Hevea brasiliensis]|uniref:B-like cyclin n=1 Tax=Hevea brasiliensis TaxID=3981 RepID=A0A6A6N3U4_HEVBR|nr:hypothetical protein GH714_031288 [Hevea brasiliensis]
MAIQQHDEQQSSSFLLDSTLYCEEERWEEEEEAEEVCQNESLHVICGQNGTRKSPFLFSSLLEQDLFWEEGELLALFSKEEEEQSQFNVYNVETDNGLSIARQEAVEWMLKVNAHYGFSALTAILAVNYLGRFISSSYYQRDKPWYDPTCGCDLSFSRCKSGRDPSASALRPPSGRHKEAWIKDPSSWEFLRRCERLLLAVLSDSRSISYLPSALATATMMHIIDQVEPLNPMVYQNQLLGVLKICKENVIDCYELILKLSKTKTIASVVTTSLTNESMNQSPAVQVV